MEQDTELEARIKNLESRLLESNQKISNPAEASKADIEENREIKESLQRQKSKRLSLMPAPSAVSIGALGSLLSSVKEDKFPFNFKFVCVSSNDKKIPFSFNSDNMSNTLLIVTISFHHVLHSLHHSYFPSIA